MPSNGISQYSTDGFAGETTGGYGGGGDWIGAAINAGAMLYDSHQNRKAAKENTDKTIAAQKREAELAYQRSLQMWNAQNMYNSPQAQMQRFIEAGLNPHLIYGQGNAGNASGFPEYQAPNLQYRYEAPRYGAAIASVLPTLMAVGTWMQNMRMSETEIRSKNVQQERTVTETIRARQLVDYLQQANPKLLQQLNNRLSLYPYQEEMMSYKTNEGRLALANLEEDFRYKYGESLFNQYNPSFRIDGAERAPIGGMKRLEYLEQESKTRLAQAKASFSDFNITDPQAIMQLVLSGVMGLAGQQLRLSTHRRPSVTHETESRMSTGRSTIRRRKYQY